GYAHTGRLVSDTAQYTVKRRRTAGHGRQARFSATGRARSGPWRKCGPGFDTRSLAMGDEVGWRVIVRRPQPTRGQVWRLTPMPGCSPSAQTIRTRCVAPDEQLQGVGE